MTGLRFWRRARGLTQVDLAARSGVERSHIGKLERGQVAEPRPATLLKLAEALGVEVLDLLYGEHAIGIFGPPADLVRQAPDTSPREAHNTHEPPTSRPLETSRGRP